MHKDELYRIKDEQTRQLTTFNLSTRHKTIWVRRGETVSAGEVMGEGYIAQIWITFPGWFWAHWDKDKPVSQSILKTLIMKIYWDGAKIPAVNAPVGDLFGNGLCQMASFGSSRFGMSSGGFFMKFPMPFKKGFRIEFENKDSIIDTDVFMNVLYQLDKLPEDSGYFHAQFHTGRNDGPSPVLIADIQGKGHYAGCSLAMQGRDKNYLSFLEAPEYIYIDGGQSNEPTIVGTGLEDYFLGGWYFREGVFTGQHHGVVVKDALTSSVAMYRIHETDAIRFRSSFRMEFINPWKAEHLLPFSYSAVSYMYVNTPEGSGPPIPALEELMCWYRIKDTDHQSTP
ncbi:glycoside hydrolase family 172 protein [Paenibacillus spongiae]|uniref:DUF2961 domain-containing protein n=1 Tax=Paenibacillus spongiae TaxID=2909671 RepID=A0ABY5S546_9BACL|nr:glycoside hydrolase family 172 protein [Paenibacillus spongiae]UVI27448.1 DUF2961 domain-containing protein [Paenibacillus spongiae]